MAAAATGKRRKSVLGRYEFERELSSDFIGRIWSGRIRSGSGLGSFVGIRRITETDTFCRNALDEITEAAFWAMDLDVPQLVTVTDVVRDHQELGIVFPPLDGSTLRSLLNTAATSARPFLEAVATRIALDVASQCSVLTRTSGFGRGSVHGAITPDSIFVDRRGRARLLDLGVAAVAGRHALKRKHVGGVSYFAPEQLAGVPTVRTDVFSLGLIVWEMLPVRRPRYAATFDELSERILFHPVADLSKLVRPSARPVDQRIAEIVARALDPSPEARFSDPMEFAVALASVAEPVTHAEAALLLGLARSSGVRRITIPERRNDSTAAQCPAGNYRDPLDTIPYDPEEWFADETSGEHPVDRPRDTFPTIDIDLSDFDSAAKAGALSKDS